MNHTFKIGQLVRIKQHNSDRMKGLYEIVRLIQAGPDGLLLYRVKHERDECVVAEDEIEKA
jgi:hypothetical protein